ncbi:MAG: helix-turn-helix domain-containing protein [Defluviitaleaceae bacterium]|nr:helix-turn-helix domain-containing protein [Defluviitaleaceae bacterium]
MFQEIFVQLLAERKISTYKLTKDTGIQNGLISKWINNVQTPAAENLAKLANYFNVSVDYLLGLDPVQNRRLSSSSGQNEAQTLQNLTSIDNAHVDLTLSERLKECRKAKGVTQKAVAEFLGIAATSYQKYELSAREPSLEFLGKLADYFGVSVDYLLGRVNKPGLIAISVSIPQTDP